MIWKVKSNDFRFSLYGILCRIEWFAWLHEKFWRFTRDGRTWDRSWQAASDFMFPKSKLVISSKRSRNVRIIREGRMNTGEIEIEGLENSNFLNFFNKKNQFHLWKLDKICISFFWSMNGALGRYCSSDSAWNPSAAAFRFSEILIKNLYVDVCRFS